VADRKRVAVYVTAMLEVWSEGKAPTYTVQTTGLRPGVVDHGGIAWARYRGHVGVWRILRALDDFGIRGTFATNANNAIGRSMTTTARGLVRPSPDFPTWPRTLPAGGRTVRDRPHTPRRPGPRQRRQAHPPTRRPS
jgi:hypothetical protein